jgi:hypothetical protein
VCCVAHGIHPRCWDLADVTGTFFVFEKRRDGIYFRGRAGTQGAALSLLAKLARKTTNPLRAQHILSGEGIVRSNNASCASECRSTLLPKLLK